MRESFKWALLQMQHTASRGYFNLIFFLSAVHGRALGWDGVCDVLSVYIRQIGVHYKEYYTDKNVASSVITRKTCAFLLKPQEGSSTTLFI